MKIISVMLIAAIASCGAFAETIDLNGEWSFSRDGAPEMVVRVPHDWSIASVPTQGAPTGKEWGFYAGGKGEYRRTFDIAEADLAKHLELAFDGVFRFAEVYVNGELAGKGTRYGYTGFRVPLDGKVKVGKNDLLVKADNSALPGCRWYMGSGIYRSVRLEKRDYPYVKPLSVDVRTQRDGTVKIAWTVVGKDGAEKDESATFKIGNPVLWTPETPKLYERDIGGEKVRFGIRTVA